MDMNQIHLLHDSTDRVTSSDAIDSETVFPARQRLKAKDKIFHSTAAAQSRSRTSTPTRMAN
ncbi:pectate lyase B [Verticillium dahliae VdLs.17]|uniref:Pectate lyase B n=1 Tax=Verticillium dahliae (strain VdLs.17 / ATCC MYA-4575 / FGSC 10137) TaxID=498257 RepID=G2XK26_VERDV|nr:pectate lyase B [Verticillium dahliae VdLs.17]EGY21526.1 pectate lyase B [Verticillium dahliae VdLs.17]KAH6700070.1 pectate lyase B [Verticillium dahliae]